MWNRWKLFFKYMCKPQPQNHHLKFYLYANLVINTFEEL